MNLRRNSNPPDVNQLISHLMNVSDNLPHSAN